MGIDYLAVLISGILAMIIGGLWYSPFLFGNIWAKESKISVEEMAAAKAKGMAWRYAANFIAALVMAYALANSLVLLEIDSISALLSVIFWIWIGFMLPIIFGSLLWENRSIKYFLINSMYYFISLLAVGTVLVLMQ